MRGSRNKFTFDFSISFAGENRVVAKEIADKLSESGARVFYDYYYKSDLLGKKLRQEFAVIYGPSAHFFVPLISEHYAQKDYTNYEWEIALEEQKKRNAEFILPIRLDDSKMIGLHSDIGFCDLRKDSTDSVVQNLLRKLGRSEREINTVWVATVGLVVNEAVRNWYRIPRFIRGTYPGVLLTYYELCDWLEQDLKRRLDKSDLKDWDIIEDSRDGETFSIRFKFYWVPSNHPLDFGTLDWWEVLEVAPLKEIYPEE